jgi:hypothetical protein
MAMFPHLKLGDDNSLPSGAKDLEEGYALLCVYQTTAKPVTNTKVNVILRYWEEKGWPNLDIYIASSHEVMVSPTTAQWTESMVLLV